MNIKSILGPILSIIGIVGLLYTVLLFSSGNEETSLRMPIIYGVLGIILLASGIGLVETIEDE